MNYPRGVIAAISTPFFEDETFNENEFRNQIDRLINLGIDGIFALGTNGENYTMSFEEKVEVIKVAIDQANHRVPVYAGVGCVSTKETVALAKKAEEMGADYLSIISPWFSKNTQEGLYNHYAAVAKASKLPIVLYNFPARTGINIDYKTLEKLSKFENIVAIKDTSGDFDNMQKYLEIKDRKFSVLAGDDSLILSCLLAGGQGCISGLANIVPEALVQLYKAFNEGNIEKAWDIQRKLRPLKDCMSLANPSSVVKYAASLIGQNLGPCRAPFGLDDDDIKQVIKETMESFLKSNY